MPDNGWGDMTPEEIREYSRVGREGGMGEGLNIPDIPQTASVEESDPRPGFTTWEALLQELFAALPAQLPDPQGRSGYFEPVGGAENTPEFQAMLEESRGINRAKSAADEGDWVARRYLESLKK